MVASPREYHCVKQVFDSTHTGKEELLKLLAGKHSSRVDQKSPPD